MILRTLGLAAALLAALAAGLPAAQPDMAALVPADAKGFVEAVDVAGLRQSVLDSAFWAGLEETEALARWRAGDPHDQMQARIEEMLARLEMDRATALRTYLGGRTAVVLLPGTAGDQAVLLTTTTHDAARKLALAAGGAEVVRYRDVGIWEVRTKEKVDRMAYAGGVMVLTNSDGDGLERVIDCIVGEDSSLLADDLFAAAVFELPPEWRIRAYAPDFRPHRRPGAAALYPEDGGRVHLEWRLLSGREDPGPRSPVALAGPDLLPAETVAGVAAAFHPTLLWEEARARAAADPQVAEKLPRLETFILGWFPGHTMDTITRAFGPEAALGLVDGQPPAMVAMVRIADGGEPVARAFKDGLAAKARLIAAFTEKREDLPRINVIEEAVGNASLLIVEGSGAILAKPLGRWADGTDLTVALADGWLIVGTAPAAVRQILDGRGGFGAVMAEAGDAPPAEPATAWGAVRPAGGTELVLEWAEKLAGAEKLDQATRLVGLSELMGLVDHFTWQRTDTPNIIRGRADVKTIE